MDWNNVSFCQPMRVPGANEELNGQTMANLIAHQLFHSQGDAFCQIIEERYQKMSSNLCTPPHSGEWNQNGLSIINTKGRCDARLQVSANVVNSTNQSVRSLFEFDNFGHDLPIWIQPNGDVHNRVMIISRDPKRINDRSEFVTLSSPFGLHNTSIRHSVIGERMSEIVEMLYDAGCSVYLTDVRKFFVEDGRGLNLVLGYQEEFNTVFEHEISLYRPTDIVVFGETASNLLRADSDLDGMWLGEHRLLPRFSQDRACNTFTALYHLVNRNDRRIGEDLCPNEYYCECVREACGL